MSILNNVMRKILFLLMMFVCLLPTASQSRKKVAVVLSGGGAKGVAHIRALKVIEDAGIPIDYVVGTSMGSIVGGLYSLGYSADQLDSLVQIQDWMFLLSDATHRKQKSLTRRESSDKYILSVPFDKTPQEALAGGVIKGKNIARLFSDLTEGYHDSIDFNTLPIPYACVAYNIVDGTEVDFRSGVLATAMRASMAIPGAFTPVRLGDKVLVDGGMVNNFPVDLAYKMGADVIIGVDVQNDLKGADELNDLGDVFGQLISLIMENKYAENVSNSDVYIKVKTTGYSAGSFNKNAIDTLLCRGHQAALAQWDNLMKLKTEVLGLPISYSPEPRMEKPLELNDTVEVIPELYPRDTPQNMLNFGARFDNETLASLMFNIHLSLNNKRRSVADFTVRLGNTSFAKLDYIFAINKNKTLHGVASYRYSYNDVDLFNRGERISNYSYRRHRANVRFMGSWHNIACSLGIQYDNFHYNNMLTLPSIPMPSSHSEEYFFSYRFDMQFDNYNERVYPTEGMRWNAGASLYTTDFWKYKGNPAIPIVNASWEMAYSPLSRFTILPMVYGRIGMKESLPFSLNNAIGGLAYGRYREQQMPFVGISYVDYVYPVMAVAALKLRQRMGSKQYLTFTSNYALSSKRIENIFTDERIFGCGLTYGYKSVIGPLEGTMYWSDRTDKIEFLLSLGYNF